MRSSSNSNGLPNQNQTSDNFSHDTVAENPISETSGTNPLPKSRFTKKETWGSAEYSISSNEQVGKVLPSVGSNRAAFPYTQTIKGSDATRNQAIAELTAFLFDCAELDSSGEKYNSFKKIISAESVLPVTMNSFQSAYELASNKEKMDKILSSGIGGEVGLEEFSNKIQELRASFDDASKSQVTAQNTNFKIEYPASHEKLDGEFKKNFGQTLSGSAAASGQDTSRRLLPKKQAEPLVNRATVDNTLHKKSSSSATTPAEFATSSAASFVAPAAIVYPKTSLPDQDKNKSTPDHLNPYLKATRFINPNGTDEKHPYGHGYSAASTTSAAVKPSSRPNNIVGNVSRIFTGAANSVSTLASFFSRGK